jgi:hypothetical protein
VYVFPPKVNVPSPQVTPTPTAIDLLVNLTVPDGGGSAAIATENTARQPNANSHFEVNILIIANLLKLAELLNSTSTALGELTLLCCTAPLNVQPGGFGYRAAGRSGTGETGGLPNTASGSATSWIPALAGTTENFHAIR